ncbi:MAG: mismatch-specific DNA-glycosylase [Nitrospiria bacterium]
MSPPLPDILEGGLDIIFVGINTGFTSAKATHYYAHSSNRFWKMLYKSGLVPTPLLPQDDWKLPRFRIGLSDVVKRVTFGSKDLSALELKKGGGILRNKMYFYRPKIVCFNGLVAYHALFGAKGDPGPTRNRMNGSRVFSIPSTSARNTRYSDGELLFFFKQLHDLRCKIRSSQ